MNEPLCVFPGGVGNLRGRQASGREVEFLLNRTSASHIHHASNLAVDAGFIEIDINQRGCGKHMAAMARTRNANAARRNKRCVGADRTRLQGDEAKTHGIEAKNPGQGLLPEIKHRQRVVPSFADD